MVDDVRSEPYSESEQALRIKVRKRMYIGAVMCIALPLLPVVIFLVQYMIPSKLMLILFISFAIVGFAGLTILVYYSQGSSMLFRSIKILRKLAPPNPVIEGKYAVVNKDPVYVLGQWGSNVIFFVAFHQHERSFEQKIKIPQVIWKWEYSLRIGAYKVARHEDEFTIPVGDGTYRTGRGILYSLLLFRQSVVAIPRDFTAEELNRIIEHLIKDVGNNGSSVTDFDNDKFL